MKKHGNLRDLTGQRFSRLLVFLEAGRTKWQKVLWKCLCDCGNETTVIGANLKTGHTKSCGCLQREMMSRTWKGRTDVKGKNSPAYKHGHYGTRGYINHFIAKYRAMKLNQTPSNADINTIQEIYRLCAELNDIFGPRSFHVDHVIPLSKGGLHHEDNLMIIPRFENLRKHTKEPQEYYGRHYKFMTEETPCLHTNLT